MMSKLDLLKDIDIIEYLEERDVVEGVVGNHNVTIEKEGEEDSIITLYKVSLEGEKYLTEGSKFLVSELYRIKYMTTEDVNKKVKQIREFNQLVKLEQELKEELSISLKGIEEPLLRIRALLEISNKKGFDVGIYDVGIQHISTLKSIIDMFKE